MPELAEGDSPWQQTLGGGAIDLVHPKVEDVDFRHIAHVLARLPRYAGHTEKGVFSVAQHSEQGARAIMRETHNYDWAKAFLLHDAHEYLIGDPTTSVVDALCAIANQIYGYPAINSDENISAGNMVRLVLRNQKARLDRVIYIAANMQWPLDQATRDCIRLYDARMCRTERDARMATPPKPWADRIEQAKPIKFVDCEPWSAGTVEKLYLTALVEFGILT